MSKWTLIIVIAAIFVLTPPVSAELVDRGGGLIYDTERDVTWLKDANYAETSGYENEYYSDGRMQWQEALDWAADLEYKCYKDWRLPDAEYDGEACSDADCEETEALSLFIYEGVRQASPDPFTDIQDRYWTQTEYPQNTDYAKTVTPSGGYGDMLKASYFYVWALRDGDSDPDNCGTDSPDDTEDDDEHKFKVTSECFISCIASTSLRSDMIAQSPQSQKFSGHIEMFIYFVLLLFISYIPVFYRRRKKHLSD